MQQNQVRLKKISDTSNCPSYENFLNSLKIINKLKKLTQKFCKEDASIKIVFNTFNLTILFSTKDKVLYGLKPQFVSFSVLAVI